MADASRSPPWRACAAALTRRTAPVQMLARPTGTVGNHRRMMRRAAKPLAGIGHRLWLRSGEAKLSLISAGVAFFGFLAIFPAVATVVAIWGYASDPEMIRNQIAVLKDFLPDDAFALLDTQVQALVSANGQTVGWALLLSTLFALWSARAGVDALIQGLDAAYGTPSRDGLRHAFRAIVLTVLLVLVALVSVLASVIVPFFLAVLPIQHVNTRWIEITNDILGASVVLFGLALAYRFGPNHPRTPAPLILPGLMLAVVLWFAASRGFMLYLANFGSYNKIYGGIGAFVVLLMWFWFSAYSVLLGAALNAVMRKPTQ